ncbi:MAG: hypothetical protein H6641_18325 [Caldilineaceae bacterium]|nr:hypothetical protein [Caldilineaceae bacterium]
MTHEANGAEVDQHSDDYTIASHGSPESSTAQTRVRIQALSSRIHMLNEFSTLINRTLELDDIIRLARQQAKWLIDYDCCFVALCEPGQPADIGVHINWDEFFEGTEAERKIQQEFVQRVLQLRQPRLFDGERTQGLTHASQIIIPLESGNEVLGLIYFLSRQSHLYTLEDVRIGFLLGTQLAGAIRNAQRFHEINDLYAKLEDAYTNLQRVKQMQDDLTHMIVHDLRNPLVSIIMAIQLLERQLNITHTAINYTRPIHLANISAQRMKTMIEELLDISKLEAGELQPQLAIVNLHALLQEQRRLYHLRADAMQKRFWAEIPTQLSPIVGDVEILRRVLDNLLDNAFKYTCAQGQVVLSAIQHDAYVEIAVEDNGPAIPAALYEDVFRKFFQVTDKLTASQLKGSGLGLTFCRLAVEAHGGRIWLESGALGGNRFVFRLPLGNSRTAS